MSLVESHLEPAIPSEKLHLDSKASHPLEAKNEQPCIFTIEEPPTFYLDSESQSNPIADRPPDFIWIDGIADLDLLAKLMNGTLTKINPNPFSETKIDEIALIPSRQ